MLELPEELSRIHNTFHILQLPKSIMDQEAVVSFDDIQVVERMNYVESLLAILERKRKLLWNKEIPLVKIQRGHRRGSKWAWEPKEEMQENYPELFTAADFEDEV